MTIGGAPCRGSRETTRRAIYSSVTVRTFAALFRRPRRAVARATRTTSTLATATISLLLVLAVACSTLAPQLELRAEITNRIQARALDGEFVYFFELSWRDSHGVLNTERVRVSRTEWMRFHDTAEVCLHPGTYGPRLDPCR